MTEQHQQQTQKDHPLQHPKAVRTMHKVSKLSLKFSAGVLILVILVVLVRLASPSKMNPPARQVTNNLPTVKPTLKKIQLDLNGPLTCNYQGKESSVSAAILNKQVFVSVTEATKSANYLLKGDCVYSWDTKNPAGTKTCDLGPAIQGVELLASFGSLDLETILNALPENNSGLSKDTATINNIAETCVEVATSEAVFAIPQNINFVDQKPQ